MGYPPIGMALPVFGAFYLAAVHGRTVVAAVTGVVLLLVSLYFRLQGGAGPELLTYDLITNAALIGCAIALAHVVRAASRVRRQQEEVVRLERQREQERAERRLEGQRLDLAREVHDSVGHALALVTVHARVARQAVDADPGVLISRLDDIVSVTRASLAELRTALAGLRSGTSARGAHGRSGGAQARHGLADIDDVAKAAQDAGLRVTYHGTDAGEVPPVVAAAAHRVVQECVTNVLRHARASAVSITVGRDGDDLLVAVVDDGVGGAGTREGAGLTGLRARVEELGGKVDVEDLGGRTVRVSLPLEPPTDATASRELR